MRIKKKNSLNKDGFTLVEVLVTVFVFTIGVLGSLLYLTSAINSTEVAKDITVATSHAEYLLEDMRARSTLANITGTDWSSWISTASLSSLDSESINVAFADTMADPLEVSATFAWITNKRNYNLCFTTKITK